MFSFYGLFSSLQQTIPIVRHQHMATKILKCSATQTCHLVVYLVSALLYQWACLHHQAMLLGVTYLLAGLRPFLWHLSPVVEMLYLERSHQTTRWCRDLGIWTLTRACWKVGVRYIATFHFDECVIWLLCPVLSFQFSKLNNKQHTVEPWFLKPPRKMIIGSRTRWAWEIENENVQLRKGEPRYLGWVIRSSKNPVFFKNRIPLYEMYKIIAGYWRKLVKQVICIAQYG